LICWGAAKQNPAVLAGDAMFLAASALGALYVLQLRNWGVTAIQAAAIVTVYSGLIVVPWHLLSAPESLWRVAPVELLWQTLWQGVLIGCVALIALNHAITRLGAERSSWRSSAIVSRASSSRPVCTNAAASVRKLGVCNRFSRNERLDSSMARSYCSATRLAMPASELK